MSATSQPTLAAFQSARQLTDVERKLLRELFTAMPDAESGVDSVRFQARHRDHLQELDQLVVEQLLRVDQERYLLTLPALALMDTSESRIFFERAELLFAGLEDAYIADPRTPIAVSTLAVSCRITEGDTRNTLSYLAKVTPWLAFQPRDVLNNMDATVGGSDVVIKQKNFWAAMNQLEVWRRKGPFQMTQEAWHAAMRGDVENSSSSASADLRPVPAWVQKLPDLIEQVMKEVYIARGEGLRVLPAVGVRTALDLFFSDALGGDQGTFEQKLKLMRDKNILSDRDVEHARRVINGGNASAHRGYTPVADDLETILAIGEQLLRAHYDFPTASKQLEANIPLRTPNPAKKIKGP